MIIFMFFCFKKKTQYDMLISDWSSDVCSADLTCIEELGHFIPSASLALVSRRIVARTRARPRHAKFGSPRKKSQKWCQGQFGRRGGLPACRTPENRPV